MGSWSPRIKRCGYLSDLAGLPEQAGGAFVSGGTMGNLSSLTVARDVGRERRPDVNPHEVRFAISDDAHASIGKALHVLGVDPLVVHTNDHRLTREALETAMANDPHPENVIGVVATAGTTNAGIIDDSKASARTLATTTSGSTLTAPTAEPPYFRPHTRHLFRGVRHADSFIVDPHKWLFAPLDCCALLYRDPLLARRFLAQQASYLDVVHTGDDEHFDWNPSDFALQLSRRARGFRSGFHS